MLLKNFKQHSLYRLKMNYFRDNFCVTDALSLKIFSDIASIA